jgi:carboxyl-terminal processing protease
MRGGVGPGQRTHAAAFPQGLTPATTLRAVRTAGIAIVCALAALPLGIFLGGHPELLPGGVRDAFVEEDRALRAEIIDKIEDNFYKPVDEERLDDASLKGIVDSLEDPYSHYLTPTEARTVRESISGEFEGVGMTVEQDRRGLRVLTVFDESPAQRAGIAKGDLILAVNGRSIAGVNSEVATGRIKGPAGSKVTLEVLSPGAEDSRTVSVERERIDVPVAEGRVVDRDGRRLGVVELLGFSSGAHGALRREINELTERGAEGLVIDLRGNGGGLLSEAVLVSSVFIEDGEIVSVRGRSRPERTEDAEGDAIDEDIPVVVLVDGGSASASEIVAGALRDRGRAALVGTNTFGKGLVQEVEPLSNGGYLDLTVANYYLPSGKTIGENGLKPEVRVKDDPKTKRDEALPVALDTLIGQRR